MECAICMCNFTADGEHIPLGLPCGHTFGGSCLQRIMFRRCPTCRERIGRPFNEIPKNFLALAILSSTKSESCSLDACIRGSRAFVTESNDNVTLQIDDLLKEMEAKRAANVSRTASISAMEVSIADLRRRLKGDEAVLILSKALALSLMTELGEQSPDAMNLRRLRKLQDVLVSEDYMSQSQNLCRDVMTNSFLAFFVPQIKFDICDLRARILEVEARADYDTREEYRNYVVSLMKLEYHYLFPSVADKFDIWSLLEMRMRLRKTKNWMLYHLEAQACEKLIDIHANVSMRLNFDDGRILDVPLHSTIEWVSHEINRVFSVASSEMPHQLRYGYETLSTKRGKLFDQNIVAKTVFSLSDLEHTYELTTTLEPNLSELKMIVGKRLTVYEAKQLVSCDEAPPHLQTVSFNGVQLSDETIVEFLFTAEGSGLHVTVHADDLEDYIVYGDTATRAATACPSSGATTGSVVPSSPPVVFVSGFQRSDTAPSTSRTVELSSPSAWSRGAVPATTRSTSTPIFRSVAATTPSIWSRGIMPISTNVAFSNATTTSVAPYAPSVWSHLPFHNLR